MKFADRLFLRWLGWFVAWGAMALFLAFRLR